MVHMSCNICFAVLKKRPFGLGNQAWAVHGLWFLIGRAKKTPPKCECDARNWQSKQLKTNGE